MDISKAHNVYFVGIGGIGMSALARYFKHLGKAVSGYDRTSTVLTQKLETEGMNINYEDTIEIIPQMVKNKPEESLVIYTPAIPKNHKQLNYFKEKNYSIFKRSEILGEISKLHKSVGVAGTHGKTTVSTMLSHILYQSKIGCNAFLGGISNNYNSNLLLSDSDMMVAEADEFDRSFLRLHLSYAIVTAMDADHLDIYGTKEGIDAAFKEFADKVKKDGLVIAKHNLDLLPRNANKLTYSLDNKEADYFVDEILTNDSNPTFNLKTPKGVIQNIKLGIPGLVNIENAVAASAMALELGVSEEELKKALVAFKGIKRRFEVVFKDNDIVYIDDYAHHPEEINALMRSVKALYPERKITGIFQPHLFTRTRDFADGFAQSLEILDDIILLPIYPAREEPIPGIDSEMLLSKIKNENKTIVEKENLVSYISERELDVLLTIGAGNIDTLCEPIKKFLEEKY